MDITFVIISYNQEKRIIECLESIKFQIEKYLKGKNIQLIISDDGSLDNTVTNIKKWLEKNKGLFTQTDLLVTDKNMGTSKNVGRAYRKIKSERFVSLAADDLVSDVDVLKTISKYDKESLVACIPYSFFGGEIIKDRQKYFNLLVPYYYDQNEIKEISRRDTAIINGGFYSSLLLNENVLKFMEKFELLDDQPRYFYILSNNENIRYNVCYEPILMYRISEGQVTNRKGKYWRKLIQDKKELIKFTIKEEPKIKNKISILLSLLAMVNPKIYGFLLRFDSCACRRNRITINNEEEINKIIDLLLEKEKINQKENYLKYIYEKAEQFLTKIM